LKVRNPYRNKLAFLYPNNKKLIKTKLVNAFRRA
jgi:hypothetical protein